MLMPTRVVGVISIIESQINDIVLFIPGFGHNYVRVEYFFDKPLVFFRFRLPVSFMLCIIEFPFFGKFLLGMEIYLLLSRFRNIYVCVWKCVCVCETHNRNPHTTSRIDCATTNQPLHLWNVLLMLTIELSAQTMDWYPRSISKHLW